MLTRAGLIALADALAATAVQHGMDRDEAVTFADRVVHRLGMTPGVLTPRFDPDRFAARVEETYHRVLTEH